MSVWSTGAPSRSFNDTLSGDSVCCDSQSRKPPLQGAFLCLHGIGVRAKGWIHQRLPLPVAGYVRRVKPAGTFVSRKPTIAQNLKGAHVMDEAYRSKEHICHKAEMKD